MTIGAGIVWSVKRKCRECGFVAVCRYTSHRVWCRKQSKRVYCGTMRVIRYPEEGE